jgi:hypothetical protein
LSKDLSSDEEFNKNSFIMKTLSLTMFLIQYNKEKEKSNASGNKSNSHLISSFSNHCNSIHNAMILDVLSELNKQNDLCSTQVKKFIKARKMI